MQGLNRWEQQGVKINSHTGDIVTAMIPISSIENVAALPEVKYMKKIVGLTGVILIACMMISSLFAPVNSAENTSATSDYSASQSQRYNGRRLHHKSRKRGTL